MYSRILFFICVITSSISLAANAKDTLTSAMVNAYNTSGLLEQNRAVLRAADEDVASAASQLAPVISWASTVSHNDRNVSNSFDTSASISLLADFTLYDSGKRSLGVEAAKFSVFATRSSLVNIEQNVLFEAVKAYLGVIRETENVFLREGNLSVISEELRAANDRFDVGEITKTDVALAEARLAASKSALAFAKGSYEQAIAGYISAIGRKPNSLEYPSFIPEVPNSLENAISIALNEHPLIDELKNLVKVTEINSKIADLSTSFTVSLGSSVSFDEDGETSGDLSVRASGPIFSGGKLYSSSRKQIALNEQVLARLYTSKISIEQNVTNAFSLLQVARAAKLAAQEQIRATEVALKGVKEEAILGARTTLDVLNAEQELLDARVQLISAKVDEHRSLYRLLLQIGRLNSDYLDLPVRKYDVKKYYDLVKNSPASITKSGRNLETVLKSLAED
jgi:outer membrane protein